MLLEVDELRGMDRGASVNGERAVRARGIGMAGSGAVKIVIELTHEQAASLRAQLDGAPREAPKDTAPPLVVHLSDPTGKEPKPGTHPPSSTASELFDSFDGVSSVRADAEIASAAAAAGRALLAEGPARELLKDGPACVPLPDEPRPVPKASDDEPVTSAQWCDLLNAAAARGRDANAIVREAFACRVRDLKQRQFQAAKDAILAAK
jgi:hypothetical protein